MILDIQCVKPSFQLMPWEPEFLAVALMELDQLRGEEPEEVA